MHKPQRDSFVIQVRGSSIYSEALSDQAPQASKFNFSAMKLFNRFRKILMRLVFSSPTTSSMASKQRSCERFDPPKTSCSSYYSSNSHYSEAIADCIEFFNKSSQEGILDGRKSDVWVWLCFMMIALITFLLGFHLFLLWYIIYTVDTRVRHAVLVGSVKHFSSLFFVGNVLMVVLCCKSIILRLIWRISFSFSFLSLFPYMGCRLWPRSLSEHWISSKAVSNGIPGSVTHSPKCP
jgi:hypothetical protein